MSRRARSTSAKLNAIDESGFDEEDGINFSVFKKLSLSGRPATAGRHRSSSITSGAVTFGDEGKLMSSERRHNIFTFQENNRRTSLENYSEKQKSQMNPPSKSTLAWGKESGLSSSRPSVGNRPESPNRTLAINTSVEGKTTFTRSIRMRKKRTSITIDYSASSTNNNSSAGKEVSSNRRASISFRRASISAQAPSSANGRRRSSIVTVSRPRSRADWNKSNYFRIEEEEPPGPEIVKPPVEACRFKFRRVARLAIVCVILCRRSYKKSEESKEEYMSFSQFHEKEKKEGDELDFNPSYFKANRQLRMSEEIKKVFRLRPEYRTEQQIRHVQMGLRNIRSFASYPIRMQQKLCKVGWIEQYGPSRAIVRQGHSPRAFYFILSGTVIVTILKISEKSGKPVSQTVAFLQTGECFGELAIINQEKRASTVISKDHIELLVISCDDFEDIFMNGGVKNVNDPDHYSFLSGLTFLKKWPFYKLQENPKESLFHYFNNGEVVIRDSKVSDWLVIVKSGSCSVLKKLKKVKPSLKGENKTLVSNDSGIKTVDVIEITSNPSILNRKASKRKRVSENKVSKAGVEESRNTSIEAAEHGNSRSQIHKLKVFSGIYLSTTPLKKRAKEIKLKPNHVEKIPPKKKDDDLFAIPEGFVQQKRTMATDLNQADKPEELTDADLNPVFVTVQVLEKGGVFGVHSLVFLDQPSLSLVSNGAECIMIKKKFYLDYATEKNMRYLRREEVPYPTEEELQQSLQEFMDWQAFRDHTFQETLIEARCQRKE